MTKKSGKEEKEQSLFEQYTNKLKEVFGKNSVIEEDIENIKIEKFPTGSYKFDKDLKGGWAKGTLIEIFGDPQSGKTTTCIHAVKEHQYKYPEEPVLWIDLEKVFDKIYFKNIGVDISKDKFILVNKTSSGEEVWETIINFAKIFKKGLIVLDSVALLLPKKEDDGLVGEAQMASAARMNSQGLRKLFPYMIPGGVTFFAINQTRVNIGGYGDPTTTTGGKGWDFYARTRVQTFSSKGVPGEYNNHRFKQVKSNYGNRDLVTETTMNHGYGFDKTKELLQLCVEEDIVTKGGSWYSYGDVKLGQGEDNVSDLLNDNLELKEELFDKLKLKLQWDL